jgi:O-glycosyl hydrolase
MGSKQPSWVSLIFEDNHQTTNLTWILWHLYGSSGFSFEVISVNSLVAQDNQNV